MAGPAAAAGRRPCMPCVAGRNAQGRGSAGRRPQGAWERRVGLAPRTGIVTRFAVGATRLGTVAEAARRLRSYGRELSGFAMNNAMASSRIGEKGNARTATRCRVRELALPQAMHAAGRMPTLLLRRESNHGCDSRAVPAGAAGTSRKPRVRLLVTRSRGATGRIRQRRTHWRGSPRHRSARSPGDGLPTRSPHPEVRCFTRPGHGCHDPHVTLPRGAQASTILDRRRRSTLWPQESATGSLRNGFSKAGKR